MSITLAVFGYALTFSVRLGHLPTFDTDGPSMEATAGGQFELAPVQHLWSGDEFGFRVGGADDGR